MHKANILRVLINAYCQIIQNEANAPQVTTHSVPAMQRPRRALKLYFILPWISCGGNAASKHQTRPRRRGVSWSWIWRWFQHNPLYVAMTVNSRCSDECWSLKTGGAFQSCSVLPSFRAKSPLVSRTSSSPNFGFFNYRGITFCIDMFIVLFSCVNFFYFTTQLC